MYSEWILALWNLKACLCRAVQFWTVCSLWSSVINLTMWCNTVGVNCGITPSLDCFHGNITEERPKTWRKKSKKPHSHTQVLLCNYQHKHIPLKASWDLWSLFQDSSGAHWQTKLGIQLGREMVDKFYLQRKSWGSDW